MAHSRLFKSICIGTGAALFSAIIWLTGLLDQWEFKTWDWRVKAFTRPSVATSSIKLILLDQASLDWGKNQNGWSWPWPRETYTPILDFCKRGGAKVVAFDVVFTEPSVYGVADDSLFGAGISRAGNFIGTVNLSDTIGQMHWPADFGGVRYNQKGTIGDFIVRPRASFPIKEVYSKAFTLGAVDDKPDSDNTFRRSRILALFDGKVFPSLGFAAYCAGTGLGPAVNIMRNDKKSLSVNGLKVPVDKNGRMLLHFTGSEGTYEAFNAAAIIQSELRLQSNRKPTVDPLRLKDCYVFFGFSAPGLFDLRPSPMSDIYPGVEIHATTLDTLLSKKFIKELPVFMVILLLLIMTMLSSGLVVYSRKTVNIVISCICMVPVALAAGFAAYPLGVWFPVVVSTLGVVLALGVGVIVNYQAEGKQKAFIKQAFKHYLGAEVIEQLISDPSRLQLGGEKRKLTLFFSDIEKFSSFSERLDPPTLTALLNDFLSDMTDIILNEGGYLDKYIGDSIVSFWNAPIVQQDHAIRACRAALCCQRKLAARRQEFFDRTGVNIKMRMGINTGDVVVGNMGSRERFNYTVLGDAANLASRLEGANKAFGTYLMVSGSTWDLLGDRFIGREMGRIRVVGRQLPVNVYELTGFAGETAPEFHAQFNDGLQLIYKGEIGKALKLFESIHGDPVSASYCARCGNVTKEALERWDGVLNLTEK